MGAGPVGLALANLLGLYGRRAVVVEARESLIDYPRGVGLDDESFRTIQTMGLVEQVSQHTVAHHIMRLVNGKGQVLVTNDPTADEFGWPRKHGFVQPLVDRELFAGLDRFPHVEARLGHELVGLERGRRSGYRDAPAHRRARDAHPARPVRRRLRGRQVVHAEAGSAPSSRVARPRRAGW